MLRRSIGCVLAMGAFAVAAANAACGTAGPSDEGAPAVNDPWAISASGETSSALGVQAWGFRKVDATTLSVRGYDADNHLVVEVRQRITMSDGQHWSLDLGVARSEGTSTLHIDLQAQSVEGGAQVTAGVPSDTISADNAARKILERLAADTHLPIGRTSSSGADIGTQSLSALNLTGGNGGGGGLTDGNGNLIGDGGADGSANNGNGGNGGGGNNGGGNNGGGGNDKCGGDMLGGLQPILGALSSVGPALFTAFTGIFQCVKEAGDAGFSFDIGVGTGFQNIPLQALATCTFKQVLQQASGGGQGSDAGAGGNPLGGLGGLGGGGGGGGAGDLTGLLGGLLGGFTSMGSSGQSCQ